MRDPLLAPLAAIAAGILASRAVTFETHELAAGITAFTILALLGRWRRMRIATWFSAGASLFLIGLAAELVHRAVPPPALKDSPLTGCVVEPPVFYEGREQFVVEAVPGGRVRVSHYAKPVPLVYGQRVEIADVRLRQPHNFDNPGAFDQVRYLARRQIYWTASTRAPIRVLPGECGSRFQALVYGLRSAALSRIEQLYSGRTYETAMMKALLIGDASQLEKVWVEEFRSTGTIHALVISGSHVAVLSAFLLFLLRALFVPRTMAATAAVAMAWLYALVSGWEAPVVRSAAGLTLFLAGRLVFREARVLNLLAAVGIGFLLIDPEQLFDASFQLSFLSVAFLGAIAWPALERTAAPLARGLAGLSEPSRDLRLPPTVAQFRVELRLLAEAITLWTDWPRRVAPLIIALPMRVVFYGFGVLLTSAVVQAGLALPMAIYFHRVSLSGLSANLLVIPLMGAIVPLGFTAIVSGWTAPAHVAGLLLRASQWIVHHHAAWEPNWRVPSPPMWLTVLLALSIVAAACSVEASRRWRVAAGAAVFALLGLVLWHPFPPTVETAQLEITAIDVGQGDGLLVAFPDRKLMLVDGGGLAFFGARPAPRFDIGEEVVSRYLWSRSIRAIDVVALSHAHQDHIGGLGAVLDNFRVGELWTGTVPDSPAWNALRAKATARGVRVIQRQRGQKIAYGGARIEFLAPAAAYAPAATARNNDSLVLRLAYGRRSFLLTGDIERAVETDLLTGNLLARADVLKIAHHGSRTSSSGPLLDAVHPSFAIISAGFENVYGHPHPDVLRRLAERGIATFRTDQFGLISISTDGDRLEVGTSRWNRK